MPSPPAPPMLLRPYTPADLPGVVDCFTQSVQTLGPPWYTPGQLAAWAPQPPDLDRWARRLSQGCVLVAEVDGTVAGFARAEASGYIDLVYVSPAHSRRGIGRALLEAACEWALLQGAPSLTSDVSHAARALFEAAGFAVLRTQVVDCRGVPIENLAMKRTVGTGTTAAPTP